MKVIYPGTFDPITLGHLDIINRASGLFDEVVIAVAESASKAPLFNLEQRVTFVKEAVTQANCQVKPFNGLLVDFMKETNLNIVIRGVRSVSDYDYEARIFHLNKTLLPGLDFILLPASAQFQAISATFVRDIIRFKGELKKFLPKCVIDALTA